MSCVILIARRPCIANCKLLPALACPDNEARLDEAFAASRRECAHAASELAFVYYGVPLKLNWRNER